jgi:hypothetical protein
VVSVAKNGEETRLKGAKVISADFKWVVASPSQTTLAAADSEGLIYLWAYDKKGIRDETPVTISVFRWYNYLTFVNDETLAATSNDGICLIDLSKDLKASIRWVSNALPQNRPVALTSGVALAGDSLFAADEQFSKLFVFDVKSGKCTEMPLPHMPRSLCAAGIRNEFLVVGGDDEATVVNALNKTVGHEIALPTRGDSNSYTVRGSLAIANTDIVLLGTQKEIYFADVHRSTFFMDQPVNDFVWKIALDQESQSLCWHGNALYGEIPIPRFTETAPEMSWLENAFGKRLVGGSKITRQISLNLTPRKSE